jgi:hypothetical protein
LLLPGGGQEYFDHDVVILLSKATRGINSFAYALWAAFLLEGTSMNIETALKEAMAIEGALGVALVDYESGMSLGTLGGGRDLDLEIASAGNTEVVRAKMRTLATLQINDSIEDILITLTRQYHLIRLLDRDGSRLFLYLALDRERANLALARHNLRRIESELSV